MNTQAIQRALTEEKAFSLSLFAFCFSLVLIGRYIAENNAPDPHFRGRYLSVKDRLQTVVANGNLAAPNKSLYLSAFCGASLFLAIFTAIGVTDAVLLCLLPVLGGLMGFGYAVGLIESEFLYAPSNASTFRRCSQHNLIENITNKLHATDHQKGICKGAGIVWAMYLRSSQDFIAAIQQKNIQDTKLLNAVYINQKKMLPRNINNNRSSNPTANKDYRVYQLTNTATYAVDLAVMNPGALIFVLIDDLIRSHVILLLVSRTNNQLKVNLYDSSSYEATFHDEVDVIKSLLTLIRIKYTSYFNKNSFEVRVQSDSQDARIHRDVESPFYKKLGKAGLLTEYIDFTNDVPLLREADFRTPGMGRGG